MSEMPKGWVEIPLEQVATWGSGGTPKRSEPSYYGGDVPWVKTGDLGPRYLKEASEYISQLGLEKSSAKLFPKGSVAIAMYGATIGKTSILDFEVSTNQACAVGYPIDGVILTDFLYYFLTSEKQNFIKKGKGGAQPNISQQLIKAHDIRLPSLPEQKRIVEKLDEVLAQVDTIKARLDGIPDLLKRFRQSVLASAVSGKLIGTDSVLWSDEKIDDLLKVVNGKAFPSKDYQTEGVRLLRPGNLHLSGRVVWNSKNTTYLPEDWASKRAELILKGGALLMNLTAQSLADDFLGRVCVFDEIDETVLLNQRICSFESKQPYDILPYMFVYFRSPQFREYVATLDSGTLIKHLNVKDIKSLVLKLPPLEEQKEIVRLVDQYFAFADTIEAQVKKAQARVDNLTQSILAKAFRGELVPQDPNDEPAEVLLQRIAKARAEAEQLAKAAKKAAKAK